MDRAIEAHRAAVVCAILGVVGTAIGLAGYWSVSGTALRLVQATGIFVSGVALLALRSHRPPSAAFANAVFLLVLVPTVMGVWMADDAVAAQSARWVPYEPNKLSVLTLAIIAPPGWATGVVAILMFVGSAVLHQLAFASAFRALAATGEPFGVIAYGVFALVLLGFRQRGHAMREQLARAQAEKLALERVARVAVALRDLANTPVQTLELVRQQLLLYAPELRVQTDRMRRALAQLRRLNDLLVPYEDAVKWDGHGHSFEDELGEPRPAATAAADPEGAAPSRAPPGPRPPA
jgi:hypothetical protein